MLRGHIKYIVFDFAVKRVAWSNEEVVAISEFFKEHIRLKKLAVKSQCEAAVARYPVLRSRTWRNIRDKVRCMGTTSSKKQMNGLV